MSETSEIAAAEYRRRAEEMDSAAQAATLAGQKAKFEQAATRWRQLASLLTCPPKLAREGDGL
jgi:hypothetical protein